MSVVQGQQTYFMFPPLADPGQLADCAYNEIVTYIAAETINPGRAVELAADGLSIQQAQQTGSTFNPVGVAVLQTAREGQGAVGITGYGVEGPAYQIGEPVPVLIRGRIYGEWSGTTQTAISNPNVFHSSTTATNRGKFTDTATSTTAGSEVAAAGHPFRVFAKLPGTGSIVLLDVNLPGAA
jgi:hypothetical protein